MARGDHGAAGRAGAPCAKGNWEWDIPTDTVTWSAELYRIFDLGPEAEHLTYDTVMSRFLPEDRPMVEFMVRRPLGDGVEAVEAGAEGEFDAILMDCQMPRMDGFKRRRRSVGTSVNVAVPRRRSSA